MGFLPTSYTVQHAPYLSGDDSDNEGYPSEDTFGDLVDREVYGWYPGQGAGTSASSASDPGGSDYDRRITTYAIVQVPNPEVYSLRDKVVLGGLDYFVAGTVMDYNTGPFGFKPGGEVFVERITG
jgi:hypothetical protein